MATYDKVKRSQAARKGWVKRRLKAYESGKLTKEEFIHIYNIEPEAMMPEYITDYYVNGAKIDIQTGEILAISEDYNEYEEYEDIDEQEYDPQRLEFAEVAIERIKSTVEGTLTSNMSDTITRLIDDIKNNLNDNELVDFMENSIEDLDTYVSAYVKYGSVYEEYEDATNVVGYLVTQANKYGYEDSTSSWLTDLNKSYKIDNSTKTRRSSRKRK